MLKHCFSIVQAVQVSQTYQHYKGNLYKIVAMCSCGQDLEKKLVIYQGLKDCQNCGPQTLRVRSYDIVFEKK